MNNKDLTNIYLDETVDVKSAWVSFASMFGKTRTGMFTLGSTLKQIEDEVKSDETKDLSNIDTLIKDKLNEYQLLDELNYYPDNNDEINDIIIKCFIRKVNYRLMKYFDDNTYEYRILNSLRKEPLTTSILYDNRKNIMEYFTDLIAISYREDNKDDKYIYTFLTNLNLVLSRLEKEHFEYHEIRNRLTLLTNIYLENYQIDNPQELINILSSIINTLDNKNTKRLIK